MAAPAPLLRVAERPRLFLSPEFADVATCAELTRLLTAESLTALAVPVRRDTTGLSAEVPVTASPLLATLVERIEATLGIGNEVGGTLRMRTYEVGEGHPPHVDTYQISGHELIATAILCVEAPSLGGETVFLDAKDNPLQVEHRTGQLVVWHNLDGATADATANHYAAPVRDGRKIILSAFFYGPPSALARANPGTRASDALRAGCRRVRPERATTDLRGFGRALVVVDDGVPTETVRFIREACFARGVRFVHLNPNRFDFGPERSLRDGDMIYRPAISTHATRVEQHLWHDKVGSFYRDPDGPLFCNINANRTFARAGVSIPRTYWIQSTDRALLRKWVDELGGLPVVVKALGHSRGVGVIRADSLASLFSIVDFALAENNRPLLTSYVPDAVHWRFVVVGDRVVSTYRNVLDDDDFRTSGSSDPRDYSATPPEDGESMAVKACHALRVDHGGVDILAHPSGRLYLLEANFPCYYAQSQVEAGVDVSGAMLDHLLMRAEALAPPSTEPILPLVGSQV